MNVKLTAWKPEYSELWFKQQLVSDEETMSYNRSWGGTVSFPESRWAGWYDRWIVHPENKRYYRYLKNEAGQFVGEMAYHFAEDTGVYLADVIILGRCRGSGYGTAALSMLCAAAKEQGIQVMYDEIAVDNPAIGLFLKLGFTEVRRTDEAVTVKKVL